MSTDGRGVLTIQRATLTVEDLAGIFKLKPGVKADPDFGEIIHEAMEDAVERGEGPALWPPGGESTVGVSVQRPNSNVEWGWSRHDARFA